MSTSQGSRRAAPASGPGRLSLGLAAGVPVLALLGALLVNGDPVPPPGASAPTEASLTRLQLPCPSDPDGRIGVGSVEAAAPGAVEVRRGGTRKQVRIRPGAVTWVGETGPAVVDGRQALAPGLLATRVDEEDGAAVACPEPRPDTWFTGVGAASIHSSTLQLVNPDAGPAVVDVTVFSPVGPTEVDDLRGITVPGGTTTTVDLSGTVPTRSELALHVRVSRGRVGVFLDDSFQRTSTTRDWLASQQEPTLSTVVVGVPVGSGTHSLVLANPGEAEALVEVRIIGERSTFAPAGWAEMSIPPGSVAVRNLDEIFGKVEGNDSIGVLVTSTLPLTASVRSLQPSGLTSAPGLTLFTRAGLVLPRGEAELFVAAPDLAGSAEVTAYDASGRRLATKRIAAKKLTGARIDLPRNAAFVTVTSETGLYGVVRVDTGPGLVTLPLVDAQVRRLIPAVRPVP